MPAFVFNVVVVLAGALAGCTHHADVKPAPQAQCAPADQTSQTDYGTGGFGCGTEAKPAPSGSGLYSGGK